MSSKTHVLTREQVRAVDRYAIEELGLPGVVLMENAARGLFDAATEMLGAGSSAVSIVCGAGNNGGDGYALARHLVLAGHQVRLATCGEPDPASDAGCNAAVCAAMGLVTQPALTPDVIGRSDLIVDALFGTGLTRPITGAAATVIEWINADDAPVLAVDVPSGLDCDTGTPLGAVIRAAATVTFVAAKPGLITAAAAPFVGRLVVSGIGAPIPAGLE